MNGFKSPEDQVDRATGRRRRWWFKGVEGDADRDGSRAARHRRDHRDRYLRPDGNRGGESGMTGDRAVVRDGWSGLRIRGTLLRRVRGDDSDLRQRLHLRLRYA